MLNNSEVCILPYSVQKGVSTCSVQKVATILHFSNIGIYWTLLKFDFHVYFIHYILTHTFRPLLRQSSGWYY
jgi:hypothetical protein